MSFAAGALVRARGREWVVQPEADERLFRLRPFGGVDEEEALLVRSLEPVEAARWSLPSAKEAGDFESTRLLRDAVRLGFRSSAGPFRSFARLAVVPRPYQLVPLLLALQLDPVRLLVADDVGIGKTIEAALIARELWDRGEVDRLAVLCPPHLAEQWQRELREKFHLDAVLVLASTARRLERDLGSDRSLFERHKVVIVSTDFIKSARYRDEFLRACPELVIVDEAHTCAFGPGRGRHQRHELLAELARDPGRHLVLVTATPHSGKEETFRSLLALLDPGLRELPADLSGRAHEGLRRRLAAHLVQRRRSDLAHYLATETPFPKREEREATYQLGPEARRLFDRVLDFAAERVDDPATGGVRRRVQWWGVLGLLRALASSPAAAAATLRSRAVAAEAESEEEADEVGIRAVLDPVELDGADAPDVEPGADAGGESEEDLRVRRRLRELAKEAEALTGEKDAKLQGILPIIRRLLDDGFRPIVFCRFVATADYLAQHLRQRLRGVETASVTGELAPEEREDRVLALAGSERRVLVCTDCLSEGINLQEHFDAVVHYDLAWNPTRHEQRDGRVDRFGQTAKRKTVRVLTYYGIDNQIDGIVLEVLLRKHQRIRSALGVSVPVPGDTERVMEAVYRGLILRRKGGATGPQMVIEEFVAPHVGQLHEEWQAAAEREAQSRASLYAHERIDTDAVERELEAAREAIGGTADVRRFVIDAIRRHRGRADGADPVVLDLREAPRALRDAVEAGDGGGTLRARFEPPIEEGEVHLHRTHPFVEGLAGYVLETALDPRAEAVASRCGVICSRRVRQRTTLVLLRARYRLFSPTRGREQELLAEDCLAAAFTGSPSEARWLPEAEAAQLLDTAPDANVAADLAWNHLEVLLRGFAALDPALADRVRERGEQLGAAHRRVREAAGPKVARVRVEAQLPPDVLGVYLFLPAGEPVPGGAR
ncbi:MAG: DEAD/DEAH box helicase [Thermoanaerobaculia bacterium]|nr:DEAD/DEAH box helicase [Thermoanaerobaculia bacterium]